MARALLTGLLGRPAPHTRIQMPSREPLPYPTPRPIPLGPEQQFNDAVERTASLLTSAVAALLTLFVLVARGTAVELVVTSLAALILVVALWLARQRLSAEKNEKKARVQGVDERHDQRAQHPTSSSKRNAF